MKNKKGQVAAVPIIFWGVTLLLASTAFIPSVKHNFRERKAVEYCVANQGMSIEDCTSAVAGMSKGEILDYIRDDDVPKKILNFGNVN